MHRIIRYCSGFLGLILLSCGSAGKLTRKAASAFTASGPLRDAHTGISVMDAVSGEYLYGYQADKYFVPASNTKIITCYAAMKYLGDSIPALYYRELPGNKLEISGAGDPGFLHKDFADERVLDFLKAYDSIHWIDEIFTESLGRGWSWDDYNDSYMVQRSPLPVYGNLASFKLVDGAIRVSPAYFSDKIKSDLPASANGMTVWRQWDINEFIVTPGKQSHVDLPFNANSGSILGMLREATGRELAIEIYSGRPLPEKILYSRPSDSLLKPMMYRSDNFFAEQSLMMVSRTLLQKFDIRMIIDRILKTDLNGLPQSPGWVDGSGLSRYNLFSPMDMVSVLRKIMELPRGEERLRAVFPGAGQGTLSNYYEDMKGAIFAKTGTLSGVVCLSGILYTKSGRKLLFSVMVNNHRSSATDVRRAVERFISRLYQL